MEITPLNKLPVIITEIGMYLTRGGDTAIISELKENNPIVTQFTAKGNILKKNKNKIEYVYNIWNVSGRIYPLTESNLDIVAKLEIGV